MRQIIQTSIQIEFFLLFLSYFYNAIELPPSHEIEVRHLRIPAVKKMELIAQLTLKRPIEVILQECCEIQANHRPVTRKDLVELKSKYVDKGKTADKQNITDILRLSETRKTIQLY